MHTGRRIGVAGTVLALTVGITQSAAAAPRQGAGNTAANPAAATTVTLITGDKVIIPNAKSPLRATRMIRPAAGREKMSFSTYTAGGHLYVVPADARRLLAAGRLDRRLFDITGLIESGYDDARRASLPLIVTYDGAVHANVAVAGSTVTRDLPSINGSAVSTDKASTTAMWNAVTSGDAKTRSTAAGIRKVWLDGARRATLDRSVPQIGAPAAWAAGWTGTGVKIAVLDTGVDQSHPDLAGGKEIAEQNFTDAPDNIDRFGHGTHVASIAAGTGAKAGGKYKGVAHGGSVLDGKVLNDSGFGLESWIIGGMEWAADQGAKVANLSLGGGDTEELDPLEEAVNTLSAQRGILFVIAAGNSGAPESVGSPGSADAALTVGAVDREDNIAPFSSRGPRIGDGAVKPDITAPGVGIAAAKAAEGFIGDPVEDGYVSLSGTSMATPHVAGSAALLAQQHPDWTGQQLKAVLTASAKENPALTVFDQGSGRVDVAKAITQTVTSEPTSVSLGTVQWPHDDDQPVTKPLTWHNAGTTDVTLNLAVNAKGPDGNPAPSGMFTLSANQVTVPAGGQAQVTLTGNTRAGTLDGTYAGTIVATGGDTRVTTPIAINREVESYNLTINIQDETGKATANWSTLLIGLDNGKFAFPYDEDGNVTVRLPKGLYVADTIIGTETAGGATHFAFLPYPSLEVNRDTTLDVDARVAKPVSITPPDPAAQLQLGDIGYDVQGAQFAFGSSFLTLDLAEVSVAHLGPALPKDKLTARINTQWTVPGGAFYGLAFFRSGTVFTGFSKVVRPRDVARVNAEFGSVAPDRGGLRFAFPFSAAGTSGSAWAVLLDVTLPGTRTEFYNGDGAVWETGLFQVKPPFDLEAQLVAPRQAYKPGHTYQASFNHAVFGPAFPKTPFPWAARRGDALELTVPLVSDAAGNAGFSLEESGNTKLFRNGELVGEFPFSGGGFFEVPPEAADYRLTTEMVRPAAVFDVSTRVSAAWTFRSRHADGAEPVALPLSAVRFTPRLDASNSAPAGTPFLVPVTLQLQSGALTRPRQLDVDVSYDEGKTWQKAQVLFNLAVLLHHPNGAGSVSLRAKATDRDGNTVDQTIIRAYKLATR